MTSVTLPPLSLYVHLPWCESKCPYCDFNAYATAGTLTEWQYLDALLADLESSLQWVQSRRIQSVFIGGGTPSLFSAECISSLLDAIRQSLNLAEDSEITLEANPGSVEQKKFDAFRQAGVNRLSLGVQSFTAASLSQLQRVHSATEAVTAIVTARGAGFENINIDLMFGLPQQTADMAQRDLQRAIELTPQHISYYQLNIEPHTFFHANPPRLPDEESIWKVERAALDMLADNGYRRYEVSAYSQAQRRCLHNLNYWRYGDYIGIGAGAHTKVSFPDAPGSVWRLVKHKQPDAYMAAAAKRNFCFSRRRVTVNQRIFEFMLNALRLTEGFSTSLFVAMTGVPFENIAGKVNDLIERGLLIREGPRIFASARGFDLLNEVHEDFLPAHEV